MVDFGRYTELMSDEMRVVHSDPEIYQERKQLGRLLVPQILKAINFDLKNTVFSYIPNTAETSFLGMMAGVEDYLITKQKEIIIDGKSIQLSTGQGIIIPAHRSNIIKAKQRFKMILTIIKSGYED